MGVREIFNSSKLCMLVEVIFEQVFGQILDSCLIFMKGQTYKNLTYMSMYRFIKDELISVPNIAVVRRRT